MMKKQSFLCITAIVASCIMSYQTVRAQETNALKVDSSATKYDGYDMEFAADTMEVKTIGFIDKQAPELIFESDTINLGVFERSDVVIVHHIPCKCNSNKDIRINNISVSNSRARVSASPVIGAGTHGTIIYILDKKSIKNGEYLDKITVHTNSNDTPEVSVYLKYEITAKK